MSNNSIVEKKMSLHILLKSLLDSISSKQDSLKQFGEILVDLEIAEKNELCIVFKDASNHFILSCDSSTNKRSNNFIDSIDDKTTKKRTDSNKIREILFTHFSTNNFQSVQRLAKLLSETTESNKSKKRKYKISNKTFEVLEEFCRCPFNNEDNNQELRNFLSTIDDYYTRLAWTFVFLCFPKTPSEKNTDYRLLLLNKILQSGHTESEFHPLDITGNDKQIEKINIVDIGRSAELEEIKKEMLANNTVLVYGIGGIGKSYICRKLFWNYYDSFSDGIEYLAWIQYNGDLTQSVTSSFYDPETNLDNIRKKYENHPVIGDMFVKLALADKPDDKMQVIKEYFSKLEARLLVFIDNADTMTKEEKKWLNSCKCRMIITSRQKIDGFYGVNINSPSPAYCKEMYIRESRGNNLDGYSLDEDRYIEKITELANYHTQTVMLIAKAQYCLGLSSEEMLDELNNTGFVLKGNDEIIDTEEYELTMAEHLTKIFNLLNVTDETQLKTIRLFSLLATNTPIKKRDIKKWFELKSLSSINELVKYGWLNRSGSEYVSIHPVIADVVKYNNKPDLEFALPMIVALNNEQTQNHWGSANNIIDHSISIISTLGTIEDERYAFFILSTASKCYNKELYTIAYDLLLKCFSIFDSLYDFSFAQIDPNSIKKALYVLMKTITLFVALSYQLELHIEVIDMFISFLSGIEKCIKKNSVELAHLYKNAAILFNNKERYTLALSYLNKARIIYKKEVGVNCADLVEVYAIVATILTEQKRFKRAEFYFNAALKISRDIGNSEYDHLIFRGLGLLRFYQLNYSEALSFSLKALDSCKSIHGSFHSSTADILNNIAEIYAEQKDYSNALSYYKLALEVYEGVYGVDHSNTVEVQKHIDEIQNLLLDI
ncbi:MAG: tetratricopeptide repeat protein [Ruminococcus sp.]|nr:tetratricopeptide repeat protein [Ruminococcus sp.]